MTCEVKWCVAQPAPGRDACPIHERHPLIQWNETAEAWRKRLAQDASRVRRAQAAQAARDEHAKSATR